MLSNDKHNIELFKRYLILHSLGIPIKKPLGEVFDLLKKYVTPYKTISIDYKGECRVCAIDKNNKFIYSLYKWDGEMKVGFTFSYWEFTKSICLEYDIPQKNIEFMLHVVLKREKLEFDEFLVALSEETEKDTYFWNIRKEYESGNFKKLK